MSSITIHYADGPDGVFAVWSEDHTYKSADGGKTYHQKLIHLLMGDDGNWREIASFSHHWLPSLITILKQQELLCRAE